MINDHRTLRVWQTSMEFAEHTYAVSRRFPTVERFGLTAQLRRAVVSIATNIAEGNGRRYRREYLYHLSVARGSLREASTLWDLAGRLRSVDEATIAKSEETADHIGLSLTRLIKTLETKTAN